MGKEKGQKKEELNSDWEILDRNALEQIWLSLAKSVAHNILKEKMTVGLIEALTKMYEQPSVANKLPDSWACCVMVISNSTGKEKLKLSEVVSMILSKEVRKKSSESEDSGSTLNFEQRGKSQKKGNQNRNQSKSVKKRKLFQNYVAGDFGKVYLRNNEPCNIIRKGEVQIQMKGSKWTLKNVRHMPKLKRNLVSMGQLGVEGYVSTFTGDSWRISNGMMIVAQDNKLGTLYLTLHTSDTLVITADKESTDLWHNRLGHMSKNGDEDFAFTRKANRDRHRGSRDL
ncbi:uncharacterized protein LOC109838767 [Asparagus officinalis]|uniref:uncharacterized protein LOC109838767 n=1 Tax=Asparagus officinalis TaxID=4686 RepID=UPI00098E58C2|nr:uncharacterized protein LOC109838767 [Asparagus officinalis]